MESTRAADARPLRALVLDADPAVETAVRALEERGFSVARAPDGASGLERLLDELLALDVLVVQQDLPGRDALAFARLVRRAGGERELALVVVTRGDADALLEAELVAVGVDAVIERGNVASMLADAAARAVADRAWRCEAPPPAAAIAAALRPPDGTDAWAVHLGPLALLPAA
jgi:CheY-like chemotaxis protein